MRPLNIINVCLGIIGEAALAGDQVFEPYVDVAPEMIAPRIIVLESRGVAAVSVVIAKDREIVIICQRQVISAILERVAAVTRIVESGNDEPGLVFIRHRKEGERERDRSRNICNDHIGKAGDNLFPGNKLDLARTKIIFWVFDVFCGREACGLEEINRVIDTF